MYMIAFWLAVVTFFVPKKYKKLFGYISISIVGIDFVYYFFADIFGFHFPMISKILAFGYQINPLIYVFRLISRLLYENGVTRTLSGSLLWLLFEDIVCFGIAFAAIKISVIKYKSDKEYDSLSEITNDEIITTNDCNLLRVIEVNAGLCTGTLRGVVIEQRINQMASQGWKFQQFESIIGRCCLFFPRYKMIICFSKEN